MSCCKKHKRRGRIYRKAECALAKALGELKCAEIAMRDLPECNLQRKRFEALVCEAETLLHDTKTGMYIE